MLLMQAFCCEVARAFTKLGIAIAASKPIMATTIMISTRVKPAFGDCFIFFMFQLSICQRSEHRNRRVIIMTFAFTELPVTTAEIAGRQMGRSASSQLSNFDAALQAYCFPKRQN